MPSLTPAVLLAIGVGALVVLVAVLALAVRARRRRVVPPAAGEPAGTWQEPPPALPPADAEPVPAAPVPAAAPAPDAAPPPSAGSGRTVADAVSRALAAREARSGDARDRLLAVLLDDPVRAVGATVELDACRRQLDRLTGALAHERATLRGVLDRLAATGLSEQQLARLSGLDAGELRALLAGDAVEPRR
jgi:hypothetical protein